MEELARMVAIEHLPFNFGEKVGFINYRQKALNPSACRLELLLHIHFLIYIKKGKKDLVKYFKKFNG